MSQAVAGGSQRFQPRRPSACQELMYMFDGDDNGVCHHLATNFGTQEWVNPVLSGQIKVSLARLYRSCCWQCCCPRRRHCQCGLMLL